MNTIRNQYCNFGFFHKVFFQKHKKCSYFDNFCRIWLVIELVLTFRALIKYAKEQFNQISLSRYIEDITYYYILQTYRQCRKKKRFDENFESHFSHRTEI